MPQPVDLMISPQWIIPVEPAGKVLEECSVVVHEGSIVALLPDSEALRKYVPEQHVKLPGQVLTPGLVNTHGHAAMSLLRGFADDQPLQSWLEDHIWPTESRWVSENFVRDGTELAIAEMIASGTTCFSDMYFFPDQVAEVSSRSGLRAQVAFPIINFPTAWARNADEYLHKGLALRDAYKDHSRINIAFGPHAPYTVDDSVLKKIAMWSEELDTCVQIHLHETALEVQQCLHATGKRPLQNLKELGFLSPLTQCVHMTQVNDDDIETLSHYNVQVIHCPSSNLKLASGFCPVSKLMANGINVALGTDSAASNNSLSLFPEIRPAALLGKAVAGDATAITAHQALAMATINGAKALGLSDRIGSIGVGKLADLIAVDLSAIPNQPLYNPLSQLVYTEQAQHVRHVWVEGKPLLKNGQLQTLHQQEITIKTKQWQQKISSAA